ncbi:MAG: radical SAM protein [Pseudomonadota bacterium]
MATAEHSAQERSDSSELEARMQRIEAFVAATRQAVFVREADQVLMIRPDKTLGINATAASILQALYARDGAGVVQVLATLGGRWQVAEQRLLDDTEALLDTVRALFNEDYTARPNLRLTDFDRGRVRFPTLAEIALTYGCQNRCQFCYASSPRREHERRPMTTAQVMQVMDKIFHQAHVPSLSFTGGESTLRPDLGQLIAHGKRLGLRTNLISNGLRLADASFARSLVDAGLDSAQISLEAAQAEVHDRIVGKSGAHARTVEGVRQLQRLGIHVHTNTTLCADNLDLAPDLLHFVARDLGLSTLSMNMVIRTGEALGRPPIGVRYSQVARRLPSLLELARDLELRLVWYSPIPYCMFNPALHGQGAKSCACVDGILSVDPTGQVLPCSSFEQGLGSLLDEDYATIRHSRAARYWHRREYVPAPCQHCPDLDLCAGACPLYWDAAGSFAEIPRPGSDDARAYARWQRRRRKGGSFGVPAHMEVS